MTIIVSGLADVPSLIAQRRPSHLVTLLDPASMIDTPPGVAAERHLKLAVNDIAEPMDGMVMPEETLVHSLIRFAGSWDETQPMLVHCWAGISRSTASAFVIACERSPQTDERDIAQALRRAARHASPNRRIVALADDVLGRHGRMVDAVAAMGDYDYSSARPFDFQVRHG